MNPRVPGLLSEIVAAAERTLKAPSSDTRRIGSLVALRDLAEQAAQWPTDERRRLANEWTCRLLELLIRIEGLHPHGDAEDMARARALAETLLPFVKADLGSALEVAAGARLPDHPHAGRAAR